MNLTNPAIDSTFALMQLSDSFFPSGSFTFSHGLESLQSLGVIQSEQDLSGVIRQFLHHKVGPTDLVALGEAYRGSAVDDLPRICDVDQLLWAQTLVQATRDTQIKSGRALLMVARETWPHPQLEALAMEQSQADFHCLHPIVFGVVSHIVGLTQHQAASAFIHGLVTGMMGAAIRLGLLGHLQAQALIKGLAPDMREAIAVSSEMTLQEMWSGTPTLDIIQMLHGQMPHRQFMN